MHSQNYACQFVSFFCPKKPRRQKESVWKHLKRPTTVQFVFACYLGMTVSEIVSTRTRLEWKINCSAVCTVGQMCRKQRNVQKCLRVCVIKISVHPEVLIIFQTQLVTHFCSCILSLLAIKSEFLLKIWCRARLANQWLVSSKTLVVYTLVIVNNQTFGGKKKNWFELLIFNPFFLLSMQYALDIQWQYYLFFKCLGSVV